MKDLSKMKDLDAIRSAYEKAREQDPTFGDDETEDRLLHWSAETLGTDDLRTFVETIEFAKAFWKNKPKRAPAKHSKALGTVRNPASYLKRHWPD